MTTQKKVLITGGLILLVQLFFFRDYISPFHWGHLKVTGLACTCPDETVVGGQLYLRTITPDSLKQYNLDYSEIYVTERPSTNIDPMGVNLYIIEGQVIGKDRVYEGSNTWNPLFRIDKWREVDMLKNWALRGLFVAQLIIWIVLLIKGRSKNGA